MNGHPSLRSLALFLAVIEHGSITAAATAFRITQPAISAQIQGLEQRFGARLLERGSRGSTPTAVGRLVAAYAARLLALSDELGRAVADVQRLRSLRLVIGAICTIGEQLLPAALDRCHAVHPGVELSVCIGNSDEIIHSVTQGGSTSRSSAGRRRTMICAPIPSSPPPSSPSWRRVIPC